MDFEKVTSGITDCKKDQYIWSGSNTSSEISWEKNKQDNTFCHMTQVDNELEK